MKTLLSVFLFIASIGLYLLHAISTTLMCGPSEFSDLELKAMMVASTFLLVTSGVIGFIPTKKATEEVKIQDHAG
jgi:hypothetical protein